jgi:hypothetical protein
MQPALIEYFGAMRSTLREGQFVETAFLLYTGMVYLWSWLNYEYLSPQKCPDCQEHMAIYFLRSKRAVTGTGSDLDLMDWLICKNELCGTAFTTNFCSQRGEDR